MAVCEYDLFCMLKDLKLNNGFKYVFNFVDRFSKYVFCKALKWKHDKHVAESLERAIKLCHKNSYYRIKIIVSDNGLSFKNKVFNKVCSKYNITHIH